METEGSSCWTTWNCSHFRKSCETNSLHDISVIYTKFIYEPCYIIFALYLNILRPKQDGRYFADIFNCIVQMKIG